MQVREGGVGWMGILQECVIMGVGATGSMETTNVDGMMVLDCRCTPSFPSLRACRHRGPCPYLPASIIFSMQAANDEIYVSLLPFLFDCRQQGDHRI